MTKPQAAEPIFWQDAEPTRLQRDLNEVAEFAPHLLYQEPHPSDGGEHIHGGWFGELPLWPFDRPEPEGLKELVGSNGLTVAVMYSAAHPMVPPTVFPVSVEPTPQEETQAAWHVAPGGSLCLLQSDGGWHPEASITELLAKAAGWHVEYALMKRSAIQEMSVQGIVTDSSFDHLVTTCTRDDHEVPEPPTIEDSVVVD
jgi:hypothetical protein